VGCLGTAAAIIVLAACGGSGKLKSASSTDLTLHLPLTDEREIPISPAAAATDGNLQLTPLAAECGLTYLIGTHAEVDYKGQLCRIRVAVRNADNTFHGFDTTMQRLVDTKGKAVKPDPQAMDIKRQDQQPTLGAGATVVVSLYFALDPGRVPKTVVLRGDNDPSGIGTTVTTKHHPGGVIITIPAQALYKPKPVF
jgi:hypothetical protein